MEKRYAYLTFLDNEYYIYSVIALYSSWLKTNSKYKFYCAYTKSVPQRTLNNLRELGIELIGVPGLVGFGRFEANLRARGSGNWASALNKLSIYKLEQFDKFIFLDADTYIYKNLDHLFECPHYTGVADGEGRNTGGPDKFIPGDNYFNQMNAGMMVVEPGPELFKAITDLMCKLQMDRPWADQTIIAELYPDWPNKPEQHLPVYYNCFGGCIFDYEKNVPDFSVDKIYVLHLVGDWKVSPWYNFDREIKKPDGEMHATLVNLLIDICKNVNIFIKEQQKQGKILNLSTVKYPAIGGWRKKPTNYIELQEKIKQAKKEEK